MSAMTQRQVMTRLQFASKALRRLRPWPWLPGLPLFYQLLLANLVVVLAGAVIGTSLTRQFVLTGAFTPWVHALMVAVAVMLSVTASALILHSAFRPIRALRGAINRYHAGDPAPQVRVEPRGDPDIQAVARALNGLWVRLEERQRQLEQTNARLAEKNREMRHRAAQVIAAQEDERRRVARELHDETMQSLAALSLGLERGLDAMPAEVPRFKEAHTLVRSLRDVAQESLDDLRKLALALRPSVLDDHGLVAALRWLARTHEAHHSVPVRVAADPEQGDSRDGRLPAPVETAIFRIVQEALTNVAKHAHADDVLVRFRAGEGVLTAAVHDNGIGIDAHLLTEAQPADQRLGRSGGGMASRPADGRQPLGIFGMRERAALLDGELTIRHHADGQTGTVVQVSIPYHPDDAPRPKKEAS